MAVLLADKFALEQCVRYLAVKGGLAPPGASVEGTPSRSPLDTLQPPSLQDHYVPSRERPSSPPEASPPASHTDRTACIPTARGTWRREVSGTLTSTAQGDALPYKHATSERPLWNGTQQHFTGPPTRCWSWKRTAQHLHRWGFFPQV